MATNPFPTANGQSGNQMTNAMSQPASNSGRGSLRPNNSFKTADSGRRQSPVDGGSRRNNPQRAWSQNTNPMNQKGPGPYSQQNGAAPNRKSTASPRSHPAKESNTADMHAHDRLLFLVSAFVGLDVSITTKGGEKFSGIFSASSLEPSETSFTLKMAHRYSPHGDSHSSNGLSEHGTPYLGNAPDHKMVFDAQDVASVAATNVSVNGMAAAKEQNGASSSFRTDTDISGGHQPGRERELQRWEPSNDTAVDMSLESADTGAGWDQFETNARLFGATSSYDENLYTTRIDRNDPSYKEKEAKAARIAREIESAQTENPHMREERGQVQQNDTTGEEEKYSGVTRDTAPNFPSLQSGQANKYTPPARRPPTGKPTVTGAPVDPAIISAQIARPGPSEQKASNAHPPQAGESSKEAPVEPSTTTTTGSPSKEVETTQATPTGKPDTDSDAKHAPANSGLNTTAPPSKPTGAVENSGSHVGAEVLDQFRQFANSEKMKLQECRRNQASYDRTIKLNELMKFSQNFKLGTLVPKDLIPILAKDRNKQEQIVERAKVQHDKKSTDAATASSSSANNNNNEQKPPPTRPAGSGRNEPPAAAPSGPAPNDRQPYPRGRQGGYPPMGPQGGRPMQNQAIHAGRGGGSLSNRLADIQQQRKGAAGMPIPAPLPINEPRHPPGGHMSGDNANNANAQKPVPTPTSAVSTKFNAMAMEFKPNPAASSFTPAETSAVSSSPTSNARTRSISRAASPSAFFGTKKPVASSERPSVRDRFNPIKRMKTEATEQSSKDYSFNGGIPPAYRTAPTWEVSAMNKDKTYDQMIKQPAVPSPQGRSASNPPMPHQHQLPYHLQHGNQNVGGQNAGPPPMMHPQHHPPSGPPHFEDQHRMQASASSSQAYPSPRLPPNHMAYHSPMGPPAQLAVGQPMPQYYGPQGPHPPQHPRHYPGGPQFGNPQNGMGAPMMMQQPSGGPYMAAPQGMGAPYNPQMHMYSPNPGHAYPHVPQPQQHSGYPSPSRGAPMMAHQGSQQGHPSPGMYMNPGQHGQPYYGSQHPGHGPPRHGQQHPHFSSSPRQSHHYPHQPRGQGNNNYNHVPHGPPPPMQAQAPPAPAPAGPPPAENAEEVK